MIQASVSPLPSCSPSSSPPLWTAAEVVRATGGISVSLESDSAPLDSAPLNSDLLWEATGLSIDSRTVNPGDLFVALEGPRSDGHAFLEQAFEKGAVAALVHRLPLSETSQAETSQSQGRKPLKPLVQVPNTLQALRDLAQAARARTQARVGAVTGSFGKTSCKEALKWILWRQGSLTASARSFNNHFGVPFSLATLKAQDRFGVFEVGTNHPGEIAPLSTLVRPHVALITTIAEMHRQNFPSLQAIGDEKAQIFAGMEAGRVGILNQENPLFQHLKDQARAKKVEVLSFGSHSSCDLRLKEIVEQGETLHFKTVFLGKRLDYSMAVMSPHWGFNSLGILGMVHGLGGDVFQAAEDLATFSLPEGRGARMQIPLSEGSITVLDESYNAGPASMKAAIEALGRLEPGPQGRRIAVLGDMLELGEDALALHRSLGEDLERHRIDLVFTSGSLMVSLFDALPLPMRGQTHADPLVLGERVADEVRPGDVLMVKGSRGQYQSYGRMQGVLRVLRQRFSTYPAL